MKLANVVLVGLAVSIFFGTNVAAHDASSGNLPSLTQSAASGAAPLGSDTVTNIPLLVIVTNKGQIRDMQHSQRLPSDVNNLLWSSLQGWIKGPAYVNGIRVGSQIFMDVALHAKPRADGTSNVYFTLASMGPVMRGYWKMRGDRINGPCSLTTGNMNAGVGGIGTRCTFKLRAGATPMAPAVVPAP